MSDDPLIAQAPLPQVSTLTPYLLVTLVCVGLDHRFNAGTSSLLSLTTLLPLVIAAITCACPCQKNERICQPFATTRLQSGPG